LKEPAPAQVLRAEQVIQARFNMEYTRGELARLLGINAASLRYYEGLGLLNEPQRDANNYRRYGQDAYNRLSFIIQAKQYGFSLEEISQFLALVGDQASPPQQIRQSVRDKIQAIDRRIAGLTQLKAQLTKLGEHAGLGKCPTIKSLFPD
jgi:DNA-binding transcriptional MerR regulator